MGYITSYLYAAKKHSRLIYMAVAIVQLLSRKNLKAE